MAIRVPTPHQVRAALKRLGYAGLLALSTRSRVPVSTLNKIRSGVTTDPGIKTVGKFWPHVQVSNG